jgi:hypothetical protein
MATTIAAVQLYSYKHSEQKPVEKAAKQEQFNDTAH